MRTLLILGVIAYIWIVGFHDGHNPKPHIVYCPSGEPALVDWHGYFCEEFEHERKLEDDRRRLQDV